jgi:hypothetical protein
VSALRTLTLVVQFKTISTTHMPLAQTCLVPLCVLGLCIYHHRSDHCGPIPREVQGHSYRFEYLCRWSCRSRHHRNSIGTTKRRWIWRSYCGHNHHWSGNWWYQSKRHSHMCRLRSTRMPGQYSKCSSLKRRSWSTLNSRSRSSSCGSTGL